MSSDAAVHFKSGHLLKERTFQFDENLPSLPVPSLEGTLTKYLESVKPFVSEEEYRETEGIVRHFGNGVGKTLHQKLVEKAKKEKNWIEKWWEDYAYLTFRTPLGVLGNMVGPFFAVGDKYPPRPGTQLERTATFLWVALKYFQMIRKESLPVMKNSSGEIVFAMNQLKSLFCTSRVPGESMDEIKRYFKTESEGSCPEHIVVMCNGHIFKMDNLFDKDGEVIGALDIQRQLAFIKDRSVTRGQGIGILTADDRSSYAKIYHHLCSLDPANEEHLEAINSSVMVLSLDSETPTNLTELFWQGMSGPNGHDRWFDKSYNCLAFENGTHSSTGDHAPLDGVVVAIYSYWCHQQLNALETRIPGSNLVENTSNPEEIVFVTDQKVEDAKLHATETYNRNASKIDILCSQFGAFGKKFVKSKGFHPDAFLQLGLQLTYYTLYNKCVPCYETATTRQYYHGRTETVRSTTQEAIEWCKSMQDPSKSVSVHFIHLQILSTVLSIDWVIGSLIDQSVGQLLCKVYCAISSSCYLFISVRALDKIRLFKAKPILLSCVL
ncbi:Peroxisomal carnitine O-octanoyltransferase [Holothuria leucospilota]|uniref:Peroxisomal carnitine O-octanoyltransferase n=1 Tax=Holothuria leucospilota TaxID=206669 RepID=A0A9Q0YLG2_HOLLE|nr:Peroxisomal carnitine O-octanoyltransferase [Holothuria leucospilota]